MEMIRKEGIKVEKQIRIGVYTICKNESKFVRKWLESMYCNGKGADRAYVLDTGSADNTVQLFKDSIKSLGIPEDWLKLEPARFYCYCFDHRSCLGANNTRRSV